MASINDNLFTILQDDAHSGEICAHLATEWGPLSARFSEKGLTMLGFDDSVRGFSEADARFRPAFLSWLAHYQSLTPSARWNCLAPEGTDFRNAVWRALLEIPDGERASYHEIAVKIGRPTADRAVGTAVGANPICLLLPCHRIVPASGGTGNYRWGADRKRALLDAEQALGSDLFERFQ